MSHVEPPKLGPESEADADIDDRDPRELELSRRSNAPAVSLWLVIGGIAMLAVIVYVVLAVI